MHVEEGLLNLVENNPKHRATSKFNKQAEVGQSANKTQSMTWHSAACSAVKHEVETHDPVKK